MADNPKRKTFFILALALSLAPNPWAVNEIVDWLMGSLADRSIDDVRLAAPLMAAGGALLLSTGRGLDALTLGEEGARSLGIDMNRLRWALALGVALTAGASVAVTGVVSFVGLVVPLRADAGDESTGLDETQHGEEAYGALGGVTQN